MSDHNDNDEDYFVDDALNFDDDDRDDVYIPYGIDDDDDDNVDVHDNYAWHNTSGYCRT